MKTLRKCFLHLHFNGDIDTAIQSLLSSMRILEFQSSKSTSTLSARTPYSIRCRDGYLRYWTKLDKSDPA